MVVGYGKKFGEPWWKWKRSIHLKNPLNRHMAVWGQPASGKSTELLSQVMQDIASHQPFVLFDTHSDLFHQVLALVITNGWKPEDVVIIDPANRKWGSPGINVFEVSEGEEPYEVIDELLGAFKAIWRDSWGNRMADLLRMCFRSLQEVDLSLAEAETFFTDDQFRKAIIGKLQNPDVKDYWEKHYLKLNEKDQRFFVEAPRNKLSEFLGHPALKVVFSQTKSTVRFNDIMNQGKCCLINLSRNHLKESRGLFGALILAKLSLAILSRESVSREHRSPVTLYCDEAYEYFVPEFCRLLAAGSRKFGISYRTFSQSPSQFREEDVDLIMACCATVVAFNLDRKGAERLAKELFTFSGRQIKHQERDIWGVKNPPSYFFVQEEVENAIYELTNQRSLEFYIRIKGPDDTGLPYMATVPPIEYPVPDPIAEDEFRTANAVFYNTPTETIEKERQERMERWRVNKKRKRNPDGVWEQSNGEDLSIQET